MRIDRLSGSAGCARRLGGAFEFKIAVAPIVAQQAEAVVGRSCRPMEVVQGHALVQAQPQSARDIGCTGPMLTEPVECVQGV